MGGNSFPETQRLSESEYTRICQLITKYLTKIGVEHRIPVEVLDKAEICAVRGMTEPYGDVDVIVAQQNETEDSKRKILSGVINLLGGVGGEFNQNDSTYSFLSRERYQIDLKFCHLPDLEFLAAFKGNNDFGALLGHLLTSLHLKWSDSGLNLKVKRQNVSGQGTVKADFILTKNIEEVCDFLSIPHNSLDGKTRLSCRDIFQILTTSRVFFANDYDEKYKIKERRKRRPVSDTFFNHLESQDQEKLLYQKRLKFKDDEVEKLFQDFRLGEVDYDEYVLRVSDIFDKREELKDKLIAMEAKVQPCTLDPKFNHVILASWYPSLKPNDLGKVYGKMKSKHSGSGPGAWSQWILDNNIEEIRHEAEKCCKQFLPKRR